MEILCFYSLSGSNTDAFLFDVIVHVTFASIIVMIVFLAKVLGFLEFCYSLME